MEDIMESFSESVWVRTKYVKKTCVGLRDQSIMFKVVWYVTSGIRANFSRYNTVQEWTKRERVGM